MKKPLTLAAAAVLTLGLASPAQAAPTTNIWHINKGANLPVHIKCNNGIVRDLDIGEFSGWTRICGTSFVGYVRNVYDTQIKMRPAGSDGAATWTTTRTDWVYAPPGAWETWIVRL